MQSLENSEWIQTSVTILIAGVTLVVAHIFTSRRDRKNAERTFRVNALARAYELLVRAGVRQRLVGLTEDGDIDVSLARGVEEAIGIVHLYGTAEQSKLSSEVARTIGEEKMMKATPLVNSLRDHIRKQLEIETLDEVPAYPRIEYAKSKKMHLTEQSQKAQT